VDQAFAIWRRVGGRATPMAESARVAPGRGAERRRKRLPSCSTSVSVSESRSAITAGQEARAPVAAEQHGQDHLIDPSTPSIRQSSRQRSAARSEPPQNSRCSTVRNAAHSGEKSCLRAFARRSITPRQPVSSHTRSKASAGSSSFPVTPNYINALPVVVMRQLLKIS
jgi:hypothetical protein